MRTVGLTLCIATAATLALAATYDASVFGSLQWRSIGPLRGGRSITCAGSPSRPYEYYFGATGGGLWKTTDGGTTWRPVTDGQIHSSSVGAVAVSESNPDIVYIGMGETELRGNRAHRWTSRRVRGLPEAHRFAGNRCPGGFGPPRRGGTVGENEARL